MDNNLPQSYGNDLPIWGWHIRLEARGEVRKLAGLGRGGNRKGGLGR